MKIYIGKKDDLRFEEFLSFPQRLYAKDSLRLKQKDIISADYETEYFLVLDENEVVCARAVLYKNSELRYQNKSAYCVGNYESIDSIEVSNFLWRNIAQHLQGKEVYCLIGPMNGSTWEQYRFNKTQTSYFFTEQEHKKYYLQQFEAAGFEPIATYTSHLDNGLAYDTIKAKELEGVLRSKGVCIREIRMEHFEEELRKIYSFSLEFFKNNFLYTSISWESFYAKYLPVKNFMNPEFVVLAEKEGVLVGFFFGIRDLFSITEKRLIVKTIARNPDEQYAGLAYVMADRVLAKAKEMNYTSSVHAFIHQDNKSKEFSSKFSGKKFKEYVLYALPIKKVSFV